MCLQTAKQLLHFLSGVGEHGARGNSVAETIQQSVPLLEAFGNAKTALNDNSSRFGKWLELSFALPSGPAAVSAAAAAAAGTASGGLRARVSGARADISLLEKSRVVAQSRDERNFHVFYQLCAGAPEKKRKELKLGTLRCSACA